MPDANDTGTGPRIAYAFTSGESVGGNLQFVKITAVRATNALEGVGAPAIANRLKVINALSVSGPPMIVGDAYQSGANDIMAFAFPATVGWTAPTVVSALTAAGVTVTADVRDYIF